MQKLALVAVLTACCPLGVFAGDQTLMLRDGRSISGSMVSGNTQYVIFRDDSGVRRRFNLNEIQSLEFNQQGQASGLSTAGRANDADNRDYPNRANRAYGNTADTRVIPAGAEIAVRTNENIDSENATEGQTFSAVIDRDVMDSSGSVMIPRGSNSRLVIRKVSTGGATSSPTLALDLQSVMVNGRNYLVSTEDLNQSGNSGVGANRRTAEMVGGGAVLGTLLGAIAGGGKGAVIGAIAGAAAGGAAQVLTRGKTVKVPAETQLTFRLDQPVRLQPY